MKTRWMRSKRLPGDTRGAVYVEFLAVFFPIFSFFMGLVQFGFIQTAAVIVQHGAMRAARIACMVSHDDPNYWNSGEGISGDKLKAVEDYARMPLVALGNANGATIEVVPTNPNRNELVTVTVRYSYTCRVPIGRFLACGEDGVKDLSGVASLPNHGAEFHY